ncbi:MAG: hypothetical protein J7M17_06085 [Anaerolineae bacterium]|nr:hypothetical protein [Anaerolineae bacterium]
MLTIMKVLEERKDTIRFVGGIIVGLIIGLIFAWVICPVKWKDATPGHLNLAYQSAYVNAAAEDYGIHHNVERARVLLGLDQKVNPWSKDPANLEQAFKEALDGADSGERAQAVTQLAGAIGVTIPEPEVIEPTEPPGKSPWLILLYLVLALAAVAVVFYLVTRLRARQQFRKAGGKAEGTAAAYGLLAPEEEAGEGEAPLRSFVASYTLGDDFFNPSFSIEEGTDFLGECGVDISEFIGTGKPNKQVTALEVWLFDKSDIRTITKVVSSEYAYNDPTLRAKLDAKGEVLLAKPGMEITLETTALRVRATLKELEFATATENIPRNSIFQKMSLEIRAWQKAGAGEVSTPPA